MIPHQTLNKNPFLSKTHLQKVCKQWKILLLFVGLFLKVEEHGKMGIVLRTWEEGVLSVVMDMESGLLYR